MLTLVASKLTGIPGATGWTQVHEFAPADSAKLKLRGHIFAVISTSHTENGIDTISAGRELLTRFHEEYYGQNSGKPFNVLRDSVQKVADEFQKSWGDVEIVAAAVVEDVVYSAAIGGGGVMIFRKGALGKILESEKGNVITASGFPLEDDVMLLATKTFFDKVPQGIIKAALSAKTPQDSVEIFGPMLHGMEGSGNLGAVVVKFEENAQLEPVYAESSAEIKRRTFFNKTEISAKVKLVTSKFLKILPQKNIYLKTEMVEEVSPESKKLTFTVAAILLVLLAVSIGFGIRQKRINDLRDKYQGILSQAQDEVDQAISLASVSSERSRELFADSQQKLNQIMAMNVKDPKIDALKQKIDNSRGAILGEYPANPQMFLDLTLLSSGFKGDLLCFSDGLIYILDKTGTRIVSVDVSTKKSRVVAGPGVINSVQGIGCYEDKVFVLQDDGIYEVDTGSKKVIDKVWSSEAFISVFAGNMYVLDKSGGQIYRYSAENGTFGSKQNWLSSATTVNFSGVNQITIDGSIYALLPNSKILKFAQGSPQSFSLSGVIPQIGNVDSINAGPDNQYLYLLDRAGSRVVITDKKGVYKAQYADPQIGQAIGLVVSETDKKIILLTGDKLFSADINN